MSSNWMRRRLRITDDRGSITPLMIVMIAAIFVIIGLTYDGGGLLDDTQRANFLAQEAGRAGAQQIDIGKFMTTGRAAMDETKATAAAKAYLQNIPDMSIPPSGINVRFGAQDTEIQVWFTVNRNVVFLTNYIGGIDKAYGNAVVVLRQGVTDAGG